MTLDLNKLEAAAMAATQGADGIERLGNHAEMLKLLTPSAVHELITRLREAEEDRNDFQKEITSIGLAATGYDFSGGLADYVKAAFTRLEEEIRISNQRGEALETAWCELSALTHDLKAAEKQRDELLALVERYRNETPVGHQPHMIAHLPDAAITKMKGGA